MTRTEAVDFLIKKPYKFGRLLGFTKLTTLHNDWMIKMLKAKTDKTGAFTFTVAASTVGLNNVTLSYGGNTNYNSYTTSTTFNVEKQDIIITYNPITDTKYKDDVTITGKVTDVNGKALYNINII